MADSSVPPDIYPAVPVYGFYIAGRTPHIWTDAEVAGITTRFGLPIAVGTDPMADPHALARTVIAWLVRHRWEPGATVAFDHEDVRMDAFITELDADIHGAGWPLMDYQSKAVIDGAPRTSGGLWVPDWTGQPHMYAGADATQWAPVSITGDPWDADLIRADVPLHELHPLVTHPPAMLEVDMRLPRLSSGDQGPAVRRMQHLLLAWHGAVLPRYGPDAMFGAETLNALASYQRASGITGPVGVCGAGTWAHLVAG